MNQTSDIPETIKVMYERIMLERALPLLLHMMFGQRGIIPPGTGMTTEWRQFGSLPVSTTPLTEGVTPAGKSLTMTKIEATAEQFGDYVEGTDLVELVSFDPVIAQSSDLLGEQAGDTMDQKARNLLHAGTNVLYAGGRTARNQIQAGDLFTGDLLRKGIKILEANKAKKVGATISGQTVSGSGGAWICVVGPSVKYDIQGDPKWVSAQNARAAAGGVSGEISGTVGEWHGSQIFDTTNAMVFPGAGSGGIDVHSTLLIGANAYGVRDLQRLEQIFKNLGSGGTTDPLNQRWTNAWKAAFATKILQQLYMLRIESAAS